MTYAVKEIFYTLQGEGLNAGRAAVFVRFSGCNLWSGREEDRHKGTGGCARWCDTNFFGTDGEGGGRFQSADDLARRIAATWRGQTPNARKLAVLTGGEPALQVDEPLITALHDEGFEVAIETNGTVPLPRGIDWVCVSPKAGTNVVVTAGHELKFVYPQEGLDPAEFETYAFGAFLLQPRDDVHRDKHTQLAVAYCLASPKWRLSLQTHKTVGIP